MSTILDKQFPGDRGVRLLVLEHHDARGSFIVCIERNGARASTFSLIELKFIALAIAMAAEKIELRREQPRHNEN